MNRISALPDFQACRSFLDDQLSTVLLKTDYTNARRTYNAANQADTFNTALPGNLPWIIISQNLSTSSRVPLVRMGWTKPLAVKSSLFVVVSSAFIVRVCAHRGHHLRLLYVFQSARHTADDIQALQCKLKRWCAGHYSGISRKSNCHNRSTRPEESRSGSITLL